MRQSSGTTGRVARAHDSDAPEPRVASRPLYRGLFAVLAVACLCLALIGAVVPGLPSTEFVLLSAWAASRSSPRLHAWLYRSALFGPALRNWHDGRRVSRRGKIAAGLAMSVCGAILIRAAPASAMVWLAVSCMAAVLIWLWRRPEPAAQGR